DEAAVQEDVGEVDEVDLLARLREDAALGLADGGRRLEGPDAVDGVLVHLQVAVDGGAPHEGNAPVRRVDQVPERQPRGQPEFHALDLQSSPLGVLRTSYGDVSAGRIAPVLS